MNNIWKFISTKSFDFNYHFSYLNIFNVKSWFIIVFSLLGLFLFVFKLGVHFIRPDMLMYLFTCVLSGLITTYLLRVINYSKNSYIRFIQHFVIYFVLFIILMVITLGVPLFFGNIQ